MISLAHGDDRSSGSVKNRLEAVEKSGGDSGKRGISIVKASKDQRCNQRPEDIRGHRTDARRLNDAIQSWSSLMSL